MTESRPGALERCVGDAARFAGDVWGRRPLHHRGERGFDDLLTLGDVDRIVTTMALRTPSFRLVRDGAPLEPSRYTKTGRTGGVSVAGLADPPRILREFAGGATIVFQGMHRFWAPVAVFCRELEGALGHPVQANAYVTPPGSRGLDVHSDAHDVFVLQAFGRKRWEVHERPAGWETAAAGRVANAGGTVMAVELAEGESLYLPRGTPHAAEAQEEVSGHLTIGIQAEEWRDVLRRALEHALEEAELRQPLAAGYHRDPARFAEELEDRLKSVRGALERVDAERVAAETVRRFLTTRLPLLGGALADVLALDRLSDSSRVRRRRGAIFEVLERDDRLIVLLGDREVRMPAWVAAAMREVAERDGAFRVRELSEALDPESRLVLVRRLVAEGLLEVVRDG